MNYQEKVSTRAEVRDLYERVVKDPTIARYRGYTETNSYGWNVQAGDYFKREGEVWFENPAYLPKTPNALQESTDSFADEVLEKTTQIERLNEEKAELCELIDLLNERIAACEEQLKRVTEERDEALAALAALREALAAIRKLTEI